jgi:hypothetical protein
MAEGQEVVDFNQIARNQEYGLSTLHTRDQRLSLSKMPTLQYFLTKATESWMKFGPDMNGNPNYGWEAVEFFS